ncbi:uncharacterized protein LOC107402258 [Peromyscus maniculatus bairdii]|uniref:uncharacterized protein LOC107402258 n=1 Tax=Peromyscus maniculatus bairdii TaxID=230844 RepID=UPI003FD29263
MGWVTRRRDFPRAAGVPSDDSPGRQAHPAGGQEPLAPALRLGGPPAPAPVPHPPPPPTDGCAAAAACVSGRVGAVGTRQPLTQMLRSAAAAAAHQQHELRATQHKREGRNGGRPAGSCAARPGGRATHPPPPKPLPTGRPRRPARGPTPPRMDDGAAPDPRREGTHPHHHPRRWPLAAVCRSPPQLPSPPLTPSGLLRPDLKIPRTNERKPPPPGAWELRWGGGGGSRGGRSRRGTGRGRAWPSGARAVLAPRGLGLPRLSLTRSRSPPPRPTSANQRPPLERRGAGLSESRRGAWRQEKGDGGVAGALANRDEESESGRVGFGAWKTGRRYKTSYNVNLCVCGGGDV